MAGGRPGGRPQAFTNLEPGATYHALRFDPRLGGLEDLGMVTTDENGEWAIPRRPIFQDYVYVLEG